MAYSPTSGSGFSQLYSDQPQPQRPPGLPLQQIGGYTGSPTGTTAYNPNTGNYWNPRQQQWFPSSGKTGNNTFYSGVTGEQVTPQQLNAEGNRSGYGQLGQSYALDALRRFSTGPVGGNSPNTFGGPQVGFPQVNPSTTSNTAATNAAFGAAKARAGALGSSALRTLQQQLADRGILGSGEEGRGLTDILASATNPLSDVNVAGLHEQVQLGESAQNRALQQAGEQYQGGIQQRGQDIQAGETGAALNLQRQQLALNALTNLLRLY